MKHFYLTIVVLFSVFSYGQTITFTDPDFKLHLLVLGYDTNFDGSIQEDEVDDITELVLGPPYNITSLDGIQHFDSLESLTIAGQPLIYVTIQSPYSTLHHIDASGCTSLLVFNKIGSSTYDANLNLVSTSNIFLETLNLSGCTALLSVNISGNKSVNSLNITGCSNLQILNVQENNLTGLDLSNFTDLKNLNFSYNPISELSIENLPIFKELICEHTSITNLTCTNLPLLETIDVRKHHMESLVLDDLPKLKDLKCGNLPDNTLDDSDYGLTSLSLSNLPELLSVDCKYNHITSLNLEDLPLLATLNCKKK